MTVTRPIPFFHRYDMPIRIFSLIFLLHCTLCCFAAEDFQVARKEYDLFRIRNKIESERIAAKSGEFKSFGQVDPPEEFRERITPGQWREFCSETVVLARIAKPVWTDVETFHAGIHVVHGGDYLIENAMVFSNIVDGNQSVLQHENYPVPKIEPGFVGNVAEIRFDFSRSDYLESPSRIDIEIMLRFPGKRNPLCPNTNHYTVWVFSAKLDIDDRLRRFIESGGVFLQEGDEGIAEASKKGKNVLVFGKEPTETRADEPMPILCHADHPALKRFPAGIHYDPLWEKLLRGLSKEELEPLAAEADPIVEIVPGSEPVRRLGLVYEEKSGSGKILYCKLPLPILKNTPEGKQLLASLLAYLEERR